MIWDNIKFYKGKYIKICNKLGSFIYPCVFKNCINNNTITVCINTDVDNIGKKVILLMLITVVVLLFLNFVMIIFYPNLIHQMNTMS